MSASTNVVTLPNVAPTPTNYPALDVKKWRAALLAFRDQRAKRKDADRVSRELKTQGDAQRDLILEALAGAPVAQCGNLMVTVKTGSNSLATITLTNGRKISLTDIKTLVLSDGSKIAADQISTVYAGRAGSTEVEVIG
jgi:hypothetical protein